MPTSVQYNSINACVIAHAFGVIGLLFAAMVCANDSLISKDKWRWHGFANKGVIKTNQNNFFGDSQDWSWEFSDAGIGGSWKPHSRLQFSAQSIYRRAGKSSQDGLQLDYGFVDFNILNSMDYGLGVRTGRVKNTYGFYNDTRDVASNKPSILLPQSIYLDSLRQLFHTMDGVSTYGNMQWGSTLLNLDLIYGKPLIDENTETVMLNYPRLGDIENEKMLVGRAMLEDDSGRWRFGYSFVQLRSDYKASANDYSVDGKTNINLNLVSFEYNYKKWQVTAEYQRRDLEYIDINYHGFQQSYASDAYYGQVSYQIKPDWRVFARHDTYYLFRDDKNGKKFEAERGLPAHETYAKDTTAGIRYDMNKHWIVAAEYHYINGSAWLARIENPNPSQTQENWDLFTVQISFKF